MYTYGKNGVVRFGGKEWSTIVCVNSITRMVTPPFSFQWGRVDMVLVVQVGLLPTPVAKLYLCMTFLLVRKRGSVSSSFIFFCFSKNWISFFISNKGMLIG